jgi:hypothetical protein
MTAIRALMRVAAVHPRRSPAPLVRRPPPRLRSLGVVAAVVIIFLTAGFTAYTLLSPILGVLLWGVALVTAVTGIVLSVTHRRAKRSGS